MISKTLERKISVNISDSLRHELAEACERSGRSLTAEVEARLRHSLDMPGSDRMLLLKFDEGLWAWANAYDRGVSLWGNLHDTVIAMVRGQIMEARPWHYTVERCRPHLPASIQAALTAAPQVCPTCRGIGKPVPQDAPVDGGRAGE